MPTAANKPKSAEEEEAEEEEEKERNRLPDDALVDVEEERKKSNSDEVLDRLDRELVGLVPVKTRIKEIADLLVVDRLRTQFGIESTRPTLHMSFTGSPGTGKTTVALRMAELLKNMGYLARGHLVNVTRDDLVGQYIGHTAPKTKEVLKRAMGGVLFIDEAYYLYRAENERDYGQETIEILLQIMENNRDDLVVILAGYKDKMDKFFSSNPGMGSRIAHHIHFPDYSPGRAHGDRAPHARRAEVRVLGRGGGRLPRLPRPADDATPLRQRPQRPQRPGAGPPAPGHPHRGREEQQAEQVRPHAHRGRGHPQEPGLRGRERRCRRGLGPTRTRPDED